MVRRLGALALGLGHQVHEAVEVVGLGHRDRLDTGHAAPGQAGEHAARPQFDEGGPAEAGQGLEGLAPAHRAAQLGRQQRRPLGRVDVDAGVHVRDDRDLGGPEDGVAEGLAQRAAGADMSEVWKAPDTGIGSTRRAPRSFASSLARRTASTVPAITTWPGAL